MADDVPRNEFGRCLLCGGPGILPDGSFCQCPIGRDMAAIDRWEREKAERKAPDSQTLPNSPIDEPEPEP